MLVVSGAAVAATAYAAFTRANWPVAAGVGAYLLVWIGRGRRGHGAAAARRHPRRAAARGALPRPQHRRHAAEPSTSTWSRSGPSRADALLTLQDIEDNAETINNVRLWDHQPLPRHVRADPGDPHLLRVRIGGQRPLRGRRRVPPDDCSRAASSTRTACRTGRGSTSGCSTRTGSAWRSARSTRVTQEGLPVLFIQDLAAALRDRSGRRPAEHLFRRAVERLRAGQHRHRRVPLPGGREQRLDPLRRHGRRRDRQPVPPPALQPALPLLRDPRERPARRRQPRHLPPQHLGTGWRPSRRSCATTPTPTW